MSARVVAKHGTQRRCRHTLLAGDGAEESRHVSNSPIPNRLVFGVATLARCSDAGPGRRERHDDDAGSLDVYTVEATAAEAAEIVEGGFESSRAGTPRPA